MTFHELAQFFSEIEKTRSRLAITEILSRLFRAAHASEIGPICYLLQGRVVPLYEPVEFGVADKFMIRAIAQACAVSEDLVNLEFKKVGDLGIVVEKVKGKGQKAKVDISDVYQRLYELTKTSGVGSQEKKVTLLAQLIADVDPLSARYLVRIPLDKLRLGFSDMTILDALSWYLTGGKALREELEAAYNIRPDIGYIATSVKEQGIKGLSHVKIKLGTPILAALCQRLPTAEEMINKMNEVAAEPKFDGVRVQIHWIKAKGKGQMVKVHSYSRNLENTTVMFPELENIHKQIMAESVILDCEAVGIDPKTGQIVPFQETTTRKRKHDIQSSLLKVPLKFFVFDLLYKNGADLLHLPLSARRVELEKTITPGELLVISPQIVTASVELLRSYHAKQIKNGLEGVVIKKWNSPYEPGRRGFSWVKFKEEEGKTGKLTDTIDAVVMGYTKGEGKRTKFGIGQFLVGVGQGDGFVSLTKVGTGVTDELWRELEKTLSALAVNQKPGEYQAVGKSLMPDVWVTPKLVVEIAGDDLTISSNHGALYAVRFPRLVRLRHDKKPAQVTSVSEITQMYKNQLSLGATRV